LVENSQHDLQQAQADEIKVKIQNGVIWMALAIWVPHPPMDGRGDKPQT
jgi:hypothetical protein